LAELAQHLLTFTVRDALVFKFLVDGHWVVDPQSAQVCSNCFGTQNSVIRVGR